MDSVRWADVTNNETPGHFERARMVQFGLCNIAVRVQVGKCLYKTLRPTKTSILLEKVKRNNANSIAFLS